MPRKPAECGTPEGFDRHIASGNAVFGKPCPPCVAAKKAQRDRWIAATPSPVPLTAEEATVLAAHQAGELVLGG